MRRQQNIGLHDLVRGFLFSLRGEGKSSSTIDYYSYLLHPLLTYAKEHDWPEDIVDSLSSLRQGEEIELPIRNLETYEFRVVKAIVSSSKEKLPGGDTLWIRLKKGKMVTKEPWVIKINQDLGSLLGKQISQGH